MNVTRLISFLWIAISSVFSLTGALYLRFEGDLSEIIPPNRLLQPLLILIVARSLVFKWYFFRRSNWRYFSLFEVVQVIKSQVTTSVLFTVVIFLSRIPDFPRSIIFIEFMLSTAIITGTGLILRLASDKRREHVKQQNGKKIPCIVLGAGGSGHFVVKNMLANTPATHLPIAVLDDNERVIGSYVHGVRVLGPLTNLQSTITTSPEVDLVVLAIPSLSAEKQDEIKQICNRAGIQLQRIRSFEDMAVYNAGQIGSEISYETMLGKEANIDHVQDVKSFFYGKSVLVTGAGGSIGSEIIAQLIPLSPRKIILLDCSEYSLFRQSHLHQHPMANGQMEITLANIREIDGLKRVFSHHKPDVVFHAAAYKHVPLTELNPHEAFLTNVIGTLNVLEVSAEHSVELFVLISSDKAVNPINVLGYTKRICENIVSLHHTLHSQSQKQLSTCAVRFGNVINSAGSVIPLFRKQIMAGGPITVTHVDVDRFFMSTQEAVTLVLAAATLGSSGEIYVLEMGQKIKVVKVAEKMLALYGRKDIPITFTGLRPGEKLTEEITEQDERLVPTKYKRVNQILTRDPKNLFPYIRHLHDKLSQMSSAQIRKELANIVSQISS